jgi:hypothetical protein
MALPSPSSRPPAPRADPARPSRARPVPLAVTPAARALRAAALLAALGLARPASSAENGPGATQFLRAVRTPTAPVLDGRLDDPAWALAPPFRDFVQVFPDEGKPPTQPTEVRVLYDDRYLYVGVLARDAEPAEMVRPLGRRDRPSYSDSVQVIVDPTHGHRRGFAFTLTAGGVQVDGIYYDDDTYTDEWDAVWDGRVAIVPEGWSAEFEIPLALLGVPDGRPQVWVFGVRREIARRHEIDQTVLVPRTTRGLLSRLGHLQGMDDLVPKPDLEILPYAAGRLTLSPDGSGRRLVPSLDLGLDLKWVASPSLRFTAAVNPDFSQVESDQIFQNLTTYELYYAEKRPFFAQGLDLFKPVGGDSDRRIPQQLLYPRRIGLETPIAAAVKLDGNAGEHLQFGLLDALVLAPDLPAGGSASRSLGFSWQRPFRIGPLDSLLVAAPSTSNFLAGVARWQAAQGLQLGATVTSAIPLRDYGCLPADVVGADGQLLPAPDLPARCQPRGGNAAAADWMLRSGDGEWRFYGQVEGSRAVKGPPAWLLADGTVLRPGDSGFGGYLGVQRISGEPWRVDLFYEYESPRLDLNAAGYLRTQNHQLAQATVKYERPNGEGPFATYDVFLRAQTAYTTDGLALNRGNGAFLGYDLVFRNFWATGCEGSLQDDRYDVREIRYKGIPYERPTFLGLSCWADTDRSRPVYLMLVGYGGRYVARAPLPATWLAGGQARLTVRPGPALETQLEVQLERNVYPGRYALADGPTIWFANLVSPLASVVLRQLVVIAPRLTLQLFAQLFVDYGTFGPYWSATSPDRAPIHPGDLAAGTPAFAPPGQPGLQSPDFHDTLLNLNAVLRWEWRLGSTFYVVYQRSQSELPWLGRGSPPASLLPGSLGSAVDTLLVKLTYWWNP